MHIVTNSAPYSPTLTHIIWLWVTNKKGYVILTHILYGISGRFFFLNYIWHLVQCPNIIFRNIFPIYSIYQIRWNHMIFCLNNTLSHTWVRYPGFSGHVVKCPILTTVVPGFPAIWLAVPFGANGAHLGICTLSEKIFFVCEISCFWVKYSFLKGELILWSHYGDKLSLCRNRQMNGKI